MRTAMESLLSTMIQMGLYGNPSEEIEKLEKKLSAARETYVGAEKSYQTMKFSDGEKELYEKVAEKWGGVLGNIVDLMQLARSSEAKDIVFQTKLLSFNASVEAARAGEAGRGFAVVAEEVGNLAQMSGTAAREITDMLQQSVQKVDKIIELTTSRIEKIVNDKRTKVSHGKGVASQCGKVLEEISTASREQATGIDEITRAMGSLNESTQKNSTSSHKTSEASSHLAHQASLLHKLVKNLWKTVYGDKGEPTAQVHPSTNGENAQIEPKTFPTEEKSAA